jgi:hypothetical protein
VAAYAWVEFDVACPACGLILDDAVWLPWGGVLSYDFSRGPVYRVGWRLLWHVDEAGDAPANTTWRSSHATNLGDPRLSAVDVVADNAPSRCIECQARIGGIKVSVRDGIITGVVVLSQLDVDPNVLAVVLDPESGEPVPRPGAMDRGQPGAGERGITQPTRAGRLGGARARAPLRRPAPDGRRPRSGGRGVGLVPRRRPLGEGPDVRRGRCSGGVDRVAAARTSGPRPHTARDQDRSRRGCSHVHARRPGAPSVLDVAIPVGDVLPAPH